MSRGWRGRLEQRPQAPAASQPFPTHVVGTQAAPQFSVGLWPEQVGQKPALGEEWRPWRTLLGTVARERREMAQERFPSPARGHDSSNWLTNEDRVQTVDSRRNTVVRGRGCLHSTLRKQQLRQGAHPSPLPQGNEGKGVQEPTDRSRQDPPPIYQHHAWALCCPSRDLGPIVLGDRSSTRPETWAHRSLTGGLNRQWAERFCTPRACWVSKSQGTQELAAWSCKG